MKIYDKVSIKEDFDKYKTGSFGIIIELYEEILKLSWWSSVKSKDEPKDTT